jgi:hypothetical protein
MIGSSDFGLRECHSTTEPAICPCSTGLIASTWRQRQQAGIDDFAGEIVTAGLLRY